MGGTLAPTGRLQTLKKNFNHGEKTMKPKNFPARKLRRKLVADKQKLYTKDIRRLIDEARNVRTKKNRGD